MFIPVKITNEDSADRLLGGDVFMRPLRDFGIWSMDDKRGDTTLDNHFRGDLDEGTMYVSTDMQKNEFIKGFSEDFKNVVKEVHLIDSYEAKYFNLFCLYRWDYDPIHDSLVVPNEKLEQFGNTVVVIRDFNEFLKRLVLGIEKMFGTKYVLMMDKVRYYNPSENRMTNVLFEKRFDYSYQNELRIALGILEENPWVIGTDKPLSLKWECCNKIINVGDITDIAYKMPVAEFLRGQTWQRYKYKWPTGIAGDSLYDHIVEETQKQKAGFKTPIYTVTAVVY